MLAEAEYFVAGQPLKIKATSPWAALDEAMEYLIQNTFSKMSYLKRLARRAAQGNPGRSCAATTSPRRQLLFQKGENNPQAIEDVRNYVDSAPGPTSRSSCTTCIEKRYALRPYGWPDDEVLLLLARLLVLGEINLMMDWRVVAYRQGVRGDHHPGQTPQDRRRQAADLRPKAIQNARNLGKELFAEMGPDGEDGLFTFLQRKLKDWQTCLTTYKTLADTGNYPGKDEITDGLTLINKLLTDKESPKFIERFNTLKNDLLDLAEQFHDLEHFYDHQKPTWEKLRRAHASSSNSTGWNWSRTPRRDRP